MHSVQRLAAIAALAITVAPGGIARAHHTYVTKYDPARLITLTGVIMSVRYVNPHVFFSVQVSGAEGGGQVWSVETESIPKVQGKGLTKEKLKIGAGVTVTGWRARKGTAELGLNSIRLPGGKTLKIRGTPR